MLDLDWEDFPGGRNSNPLPSILAGKIPQTEEPGGQEAIGSQSRI